MKKRNFHISAEQCLKAFFVLFVALVCIFSSLLIPSGAAFSAEGEQTEAAPAEPKENPPILDELDILGKENDGFAYKTDGRIDPFMPFEQVVYTGAEEELTGMRKFEPGQLSLVAIVLDNGNNFAMVEDSSGKGYVIRKGIKIGRTGEVEDIAVNKVVIREFVHTVTGEKQIKTVEMLLRKEGEQLQ